MHASPCRTGLCLLLSDSAAVLAALLLSWCLRAPFADNLTFLRYLDILLILPPLWVVFAAQRLYPAALYAPQEEFAKIVCYASVVFLVAWALLFFSRNILYSRVIFFSTWLLSLMFIPFLRHLVRKRFSGRAWWGHSVVVCGDSQEAEDLYINLQDEHDIGLKPMALCALDDSFSIKGSMPVCSLAEMVDMAHAPSRPYALLVLKHLDERNQDIITEFTRNFAKTLFIFSVLGPMHLWVSSTDLGSRVALETHQKLLDPRRQLLKRILDIILSAICLLLVLPVGLILCILIWLEDRGPLFYSQKRVGRNGRAIRIWKFRTMVPDADKVLADYLAGRPDLAEEWAAQHKLSNDPRITRIGKFIRRTSLDELPQLWNVLCGELSLVGPRPIVQAEIEKYGSAYELYSRVRPGLTGLWQVSGRSSLGYDKRVALDAYYIRNWSVWFDIYILARTPGALLQTGNAV